MSELPRAAAAERNRDPILQVLAEVLPEQADVLEVASGTGQHVEHFARALPDAHWRPSEPDPGLRAAIGARIHQAGLHNVDTPLDLDVLAAAWPPLTVDAVIVANLFHISGAATVPAFFQRAAGICRAGAVVHVYGPFKQGGEFTSPGDRRFDATLRARNPAWGIRDMTDVLAHAEAAGFALQRQIAMPANNFSLVFKLQGAG